MQHPGEEAFPGDHLLKGEMQANLPNQGWGRQHPQHLQHPQLTRQSWHEGQQHPAYLSEVSRQYPMTGRDRVVRQTSERERISKELIGRPSNFQHLGHINRAVTSNQTKEEVQNLFHMVNLYQEQVGALPGKPAEKSYDGDSSSLDGLHGTTSGSGSLAASDGLRRQIDSGETGSRAFEDGVDDAGKVTFGEPSGFSHFEEVQKHDHSRFGSMKIRKEMISAPKDFQHVQSYGRQDLERAANTHQPVDVAKSLERTRLKDGDQEGEKTKTLKKSFSARLLGSSHSLPRDGKLRKDMIGSPKNFHHVMGSGRILAGLELNNDQQEEEADTRSIEALSDPAVNLRKDLVDRDKDHEHVMDTGHTNDTQELKNLKISIMEEEEEEEDRRPRYSPSPPPPPPHLHPPTRLSHSRPPPSHPPPPPPPAPISQHSSPSSYSPLHYSTSSPTHTRFSHSPSPPTHPRHHHSSSPPRLPHSSPPPPPPHAYSSSPPPPPPHAYSSTPPPPPPHAYSSSPPRLPHSPPPPPPPHAYSSSPPTHPRFHESSPPRRLHSSPTRHLPHSSSPTHHRLHHSSPPSHPPPPVPPSTSPSSNRRRASRVRKEMIGTPTNFQHVMGTAPYSASHEGVPLTSVQTGEDENPLLGSQEDRQKSALREGAEASEASKPFRKKSTIGPPTNFQHVVHIDNNTPELDVKQLLSENTSEAGGGGGSVHDISSRGAASSHGGARQGTDRKGIPLLLRPPAHAKIRKDMIGAPTNFQHISHAGFDVGKT